MSIDIGRNTDVGVTVGYAKFGVDSMVSKLLFWDVPFFFFFPKTCTELQLRKMDCTELEIHC